MTSQRDQRIDDEAAALWCALHDGPPPAGCHGSELLHLAVCSSDLAQYQRLNLSRLGDRNLVWPKT
jgi:hypothetical protein